MRRSFAGFIIGGIFAFIGVALLAGAAFAMVYSNNIIKNCDSVEAEITKIDEYNTGADSGSSHEVYVSYRYEGTDYNDVRISYYSSSMYKGKEMTVYVDKDNPYKIHIRQASTLVAAILGGIGGVFALMGVVFITTNAIGNHRSGKSGKYDTNGVNVIHEGGIQTDVTATITGFERYTENGISYRVVCEYQDIYSGLKYIFYSRYMTTDPVGIYSIGEPINVKANAGTYANYFVDTSKIDNYVAGMQQ